MRPQDAVSSLKPASATQETLDLPALSVFPFLNAFQGLGQKLFEALAQDVEQHAC